ncbi:MAG: acyl-CoA thioesterase [Bacteroidetes bacterium]|nr:acyl-CoA thioesterase [Bacteroidota bacterium]MCH8169707.1 acyl-CoA thioesterase [Bacteroidota bacterium]MCH8942901.1 acyl-CoA thioesterase [Bacteroidota bacterium]
MNSIFESEIAIRPDDIDLNNHVHNTKYIDYVLAARYDQMINEYKMSMKDFEELGYNWIVSITYIEYKRALNLDDKILVRTQMDSVNGAQCKVNFWIVKKENNKIAALGYLTYTMISLKSGRPVRVPEEIIKKYSI